MGWAVIPPCSYGRGNVGLLQTDLCQHTVAPQTAEVSFPWPRGRLLWTHASTGDSQTLQASLLQSLVRSLLLSPGSWYTQIMVCALQEFLLPQFCGNSEIKSCWSSKSDSLGILTHLCRILRLGSLLWEVELSQQCKNFFLICGE